MTERTERKDQIRFTEAKRENKVDVYHQVVLQSILDDSANAMYAGNVLYMTIKSALEGHTAEVTGDLFHVFRKFCLSYAMAQDTQLPFQNESLAMINAEFAALLEKNRTGFAQRLMDR